MNADPTDTRFPHLDLGDLIAEANGQTIGDRSLEHLASCEHCQLEVNRWNLVADGVRSLAAAAPETAQSARPRRSGRRVLARPVRRALLVAGSAAAALVLLVWVGAVAGLVHVHVDFSGGGTQTTLTAVTGCARVEQAAGMLEQVNGSSVVIKTASGQPVTVTTTATTRLIASGALLSVISDGSPVLVTGPTSNGAIAADFVTVGGRPSLSALPGLVVVRGTVANASTTGFTVLTPTGVRVPVTISGGTDVAVFHASLSQMQVGSSTTAVGYAGPHGTLSALAVLQSPSWPAGAHNKVTVRVKDCSPASINHEMMALAGG
jgi:hypothetical protein